ncbi:MAG: Zn-dependent hydrolase, partial [Myxococcota bacterium]
MSAKPVNTYGYGARAAKRCRLLSRPPYSEVDDALCRRYLTHAHRATLDKLIEWMSEAGMTVREDAIATLIGRYEGQEPNAPALLIGSHVDSVPDGGAYDGMLGVMLGLACVEILHREGIRLPFALEVVAFGDEEGSRFHSTMNGSRAMAGEWDERVLADRDIDGISMLEAYRAFGVSGTPESVAIDPDHYLGFIEPHIEQGPVLEARERALGVVEAIAGQKRLAITFSGSADHAGTTPMELRRDALTAASEAILAVEDGARQTDGVVATVGKIEARPGTPNVIPGEVRFFIDIRSGQDSLRDSTLAGLED